MAGGDAMDSKRDAVDGLLRELTDDEATAVMEGRLPAADSQSVDEAALRLAERLLDDPNGEPKRSGVSRVVRLATAQPWMQMAASFVVGVLMTVVVIIPGEFTRGGASSVASTNVVYLELSRSANPRDLPVVRVEPREPWVSLVAYPQFADADLLDVFVERAYDDGADPARWTPLFEDVVGVGTQDSVVVNIPSSMLSTGTHRLRIESRRDGETLDSLVLPFVVR